MRSHDTDAINWVCSLGPDRVTRAQKQVLLRIADHWSERFHSANVSNGELCEDLQYTEQHLRKILRALHNERLIEYTPGVGAGNWSQFRFSGGGSETERRGCAEGAHKERRKSAERANFRYPQ
jgi:MarR-like DNA-binding transcriptional regulator SgrR of sgrS sRNA